MTAIKNGYEKDGVIYINARAVNPMAQVFSHELTHTLEGTEEYDVLMNTVKAELLKNGQDYELVTRNGIRELYQSAGIELTDPELDREVMAQFAEKYLFTDEEKIMQFVTDNRSGALKVWDWIKSAVNRVTGKEKTFLQTAEGLYAKAFKAAGNVKGTENSYAGVKAETANVGTLAEAERMEQQGVDAETVRKETGWFRGMDGKWRFEIDDSTAALFEKPKFEMHYDDEGEAYQTAKLEDIVKHDALFDAYPELKKYTVIIQETEPGTYGAFFRKDNQIVLNRELFKRYTKEYKEYLDGGRKAEIERIESTPEYKEYSKFYDDESLTDELSTEEWLEQEKAARDKFFASELGKRYYALNWGKVDIAKFEPGWSEQAKSVLIHEVQHAIQQIEGYASGASTSDKNYDKYAGEIEARDVSKRINLSQAERMNQRPDIDRDDAIVSNRSGVQHSIVEGFTDDNGNYYNSAVLLDTDFFNGISPRNWWRKLKQYVEGRAANNPFIMTIQDENGNIQILQFARNQDRSEKNGNAHRVITELYQTKDNISKLAVIHIDEIAEISEENNPYYSDERSHGWLDEHGWLHRNANVINAKNGAIYNLTFDIAKAADGRTILYATNGKIKKVGNADVNSLKIRGSEQNPNSNATVSHTAPDVKTEFSLSPARDTDYMTAVESGDMKTAQRMVDEAAKAAGFTKCISNFFVSDDVILESSGMKESQKKAFELGQKYKDIDPREWPDSVFSEVYGWTGKTGITRERFFKAGLRDALPEYRLAVRFGDIPKDGVSRNWATGETERGTSAVHWLDQRTQNRKTVYDAIYGMQGVDKYVIGGWDFNIFGSDGEPLVVYPQNIVKFQIWRI